MQITHEEARRLIQFNADEALNAREKTMLTAHISDCLECRAYEAEIKQLESILMPVMKRQWALLPPPLSTGSLRIKTEEQISTGAKLAMRTVLVSLVFVIFAFSAWHFTYAGLLLPGPSPVSAQPAPIPSIQSTSTKINFENCDTILYTVRVNDTLASIAADFSISQEQILSINNLKTDTIYMGTTLIIPVCDLTPTVVVKPSMSMTGLLPAISSATSSPEVDGY